MSQNILYTDANGAEQFFSEDTVVPALKWVSTHQPGGLFVYRAAGSQQIIYASDAVIRIFGCRNAAEFIELTGGTFPGIVHPDDRKETLDSIDTQIAQAKNQNLDRVEYRIIRRDGTVCWLEDYGHFTRLPEFGDVFYVYITDISEKHRQESEHLRQQNIYAGLIAVHGNMHQDDLSKCRVNLTSGLIEDFKGSNV
ncbi:MAG: PAS domain-containing protein [Succinivibrionaceae bacterium]|nr:PAS domain-containing protein [Succinivibrionaceae bacterium]